MDKKFLIEVLRSRKQELEEDSAVQEYVKVLDNIKELSTREKYITKPKKKKSYRKPKMLTIKSERITGFNRDAQNSPAKNKPYGERIRYIYDSAIKVLQDLGGKATVEDVEKKMSKDYDVNWDKKNNQYLTNYIALFNKSYPEEIRLDMHPTKKNGAKRHQGYKEIELIK